MNKIIRVYRGKKSFSSFIGIVDPKDESKLVGFHGKLPMNYYLTSQFEVVGNSVKLL